MSDRQSKGCLIVTLVWCVIIALLAVGYKFLLHPRLANKLTSATSSGSNYDFEIKIAADSFSGYSILRSEELKTGLRSSQIRLTIEDDGADYAARLDALKRGEIQMAVFTVDSLITASAKAGEFPGTIVLVIDETRGADALVANQTAVPSLQDLNHPDARIVLTPNSPSEFLARVVIAHFNLPKLPADWAIEADGAGEVYKLLRNAGPNDKRAYVLWEPYVSLARQQNNIDILLDTSKLKGYIVDVLVARRQFLQEHPDRVRQVVEAYCRASHTHASQPDGMIKLVQEDARRTGADSLDTTQAGQIVKGVQWKNTLENYAHFGIVPPAEQGGLPLLEDIVGNIIDVLVKTRALPADPLDGKHHTLFYDRILRDMRAENFHPGNKLNLIPGLDPGTSTGETVRPEQTLPALTPQQWDSLRPVGELQAAPVDFTRGSSRITLGSSRDLQTLAKRLQSFPLFYLQILGHTRAEGDPEANQALARSRAQAVAEFLQQQGLSPNRLRAQPAPTSVTGGEAQAVSFVVGQLAY